MATIIRARTASLAGTLDAYGLPLEQGAGIGLVAGALTAGAGLVRRRTLEGS